jgi:hypothetical protein
MLVHFLISDKGSILLLQPRLGQDHPQQLQQQNLHVLIVGVSGTSVSYDDEALAFFEVFFLAFL